MSFEVFVKICLPYHKYYRIPIYFGQKKQPRIGFTDVNVVFYIKAYFGLILDLNSDHFHYNNLRSKRTAIFVL